MDVPHEELQDESVARVAAIDIAKQRSGVYAAAERDP